VFAIVFQDFAAAVVWSAEMNTKLSVQAKKVEPLLEAGAQVQQLINGECLDDYPGN
jgi:AP-2 complex subunit alpha